MAIRVTFPADVNPEPEAKFSRCMRDAFPQDPHLTVTSTRWPTPNRPSLWLLAALLVLVCLAMSGCSGAEAQERGVRAAVDQDVAPLSRQETGAQAACGPGATVSWVSDTEHECLRETL